MSPKRLRSILLAAYLAVLAFPALCASAASPNSAATVVVAKSFMFAPTTLTVGVGTTVTWSNQDEEPHTVVSDTGLFSSGALDTNDSFSFTFASAGVYHFICSIHPQMVGTIVVQ